MDPAIGHIMPVLNSPLLSVHVSIIMMSYALLALTFICGLTALTLSALQHMRGCQQTAQEQSAALMILSRIFLYPAITTLGLGIFIGAIWANISWGNYWSWDPKETWAAVTWFAYLAYIHVRIRSDRYRRAALWGLFISFILLQMCWWGINYLPSAQGASVHTYTLG